MNKVNYDITNTICIFTVLSVFIAIVMIPLLLSATINAAVGEGGGGGLKINVHGLPMEMDFTFYLIQTGSSSVLHFTILAIRNWNG